MPKVSALSTASSKVLPHENFDKMAVIHVSSIQGKLCEHLCLQVGEDGHYPMSSQHSDLEVVCLRSLLGKPKLKHWPLTSSWLVDCYLWGTVCRHSYIIH